VVLADGRNADATIVGQDPDTDIAILDLEIGDLPIMPMGRSDTLRVGDIVLAIGNPYGLSQTVTQGIVSATGRGQLGLATFENFIQTDAAINLATPAAPSSTRMATWSASTPQCSTEPTEDLRASASRSPSIWCAA